MFEKYYSDYSGSFTGFCKFHNEVINMPRDQFSDTGLEKIRVLAGYLLLTQGKLDSDGCNYKEIMQVINKELIFDNYPLYRDITLENRYFVFNDIEHHYAVEGRMFRHLMSLCAFFGFIKSISRQHKIINYEKCKEYYLSDDSFLVPVARNNLVMLNAKNNEFIKSLKEIEVTANTDYRPTYSILHYMKSINRPVTRFELSVLLGRIDKLKTEKEILSRALEIGRTLPLEENKQISFFFRNMNWVDNNDNLFQYARSQEPYFKFNNYLLFMQAFDLITFNEITNTYSLTTYSKKILSDSISYLIADLEELLRIIDDDNEKNAELNELILFQRDPELLDMAKSDRTFIERMNFRSLRNPTYDSSGKRVRNKLIAELAKIQADYMCQYAQKHIFKMPNGKYYCEAHHIIEFNNEQGPDITTNLLVLGPEAHMIAHHACQEEKDDFYLQLLKNGALDIERFKEMITLYHCLTSSHIDILSRKKIITAKERNELVELLNAQTSA